MADLYPFQLPTTTNTALNDVVIVQSNSTGQVDGVLISDFLPDNSVKPNDLQNGTGTTWAWQNYTPTWSAPTNPVIGNGTMTARYMQIGKTVFYTVNVTFGSTTTYGSGEYNWSVPVTPLATQKYALGSAWGLDSGVSYYGGTAKLTTSSTKVSIHSSASNTNAWGTSGPFAFSNGDEIAFTITYEAA